MRSYVLVALGAVTVSPCLAPALAQTTEMGEAVVGSEVVVVTGIGLNRPGGELIESTTVLDSEAIIEELDGGLGDTLSAQPGVSSTAFGPGASRPIIRGLGAERVQVLTNGIGVIDASAASPDHAPTADPLGAQRIEILRGPATLAYGGGASGGVVNVIDGLIAEQPGETGGQAYAGYTSVDEGTTLSGRGVLASGPMTLVITGASRDADDIEIPGFAESRRQRALEEAEHDEEDHDEEEGEEHDHEEEEEAFGTLPNSFSDTDNYSVGISFSGENGFIGASVRQLDSEYGLVGHGHHHHDEEEHGDEDHDEEEHDEEEGEESPFIVLEQTRYDIAGGVNFDDGYFDRLRVAVTGVEYQHVEFEGPDEPGTTLTNDGVEGRAELLHEHANGVRGSWGVQASRRDFVALGEEAFVTPTVTEQAGLFVFEEFEAGGFGLEGGVRFDKVDLDNQVMGSRSFDTLNASFGVHMHPTEAWFVGASVSRTERAPTDVELFADGPHLATQQFEIGDPSLDTETGINLEGTARWESGPLELGLNVFYIDFSDFIYFAPTGDEEDELPVFRIAQDDANFIGGELTARYDFGRVGGVGWAVDGALDVVEAELDAGGNLPRIPPLSASLGLEAEAGRFSGRIGTNWADAQTDVAAFELPTDSYVTLDARVTYAATDNVDLILSGSNLTDEEVRLHASPLKDLAPMPGRNVRVALRARF